MDTRERFLAAMNYGNLDRVPFWEFWGFEKETINRWRCEGLMNMNVTDFFGLDTWEMIQIDTGPIPSFVPRTISEDERSKIEVREDGVTVRVLKNRPTIIYSGIDYPVKDRKDFDKIKKRYNPTDPRRYPKTWSNDLLDYYEKANHPIGLWAPAFFRQAQNHWMGTRNLLIAFHKNPRFVHEMFSFWADFLIETTRQAVENAKIDFVCLTEDIAGRNGPLISPRIYREFILPYEKEVIEFFKRNGITIVMVDCSGDITQLIPIFLEAGYNCLTPVEAQAGMNVLKLRREYGKELRFIGNISLQAIIKGGETIIREVSSKAPLVKEGGYIPSTDDIVSPDVSLQNYAYYLKILKKFL